MRIYPAVDSNTLTYLLDAVGVDSYDTALDTSGLVDERIAIVWCLFFGNCSPWVPPTVQIEYDKIKTAEKRDPHDRWTKYHLQDMPLRAPEDSLQKRTEELLPHHNKGSERARLFCPRTARHAGGRADKP